jgi:hypothetical protein
MDINGTVSFITKTNNGTTVFLPPHVGKVGGCGSVVVKALCYKPEGLRSDEVKIFNLSNPFSCTRPWGSLCLKQE